MESYRKKNNVFMVRSPYATVEINEDVCNGCNTCVDVCLMDVFAPNPVKGKPPIIMYPDECWFEGCCLENCPLYDKGAIKLNTPLPMKVSALRG